MKILLALIALFWPMSAMSSQCGEPSAKKWNTVVKFKAATVTLYWTAVYEAQPKVCRITYKAITGTPQSLEVWGHPEPNEATSQIAFVSCRDDGCNSDIVVADIARSELLKTKLPITDSQFYLKARWLESGHRLQVEVERFQSDPPHNRYLQHYECLTTEGIVCKQLESNPQLNRTRADNARAG